MTEIRCPRRAARFAALGGDLLIVAFACAAPTTAIADQPAVLDSQSIVRSLSAPAHAPATRALVVAPRTAAGSGAAAGADAAAGAIADERKVALDIRFANDSDRLTTAAHAQLAQLGTALNSPELVRTRFLIAGHTSATGSATHNLRLSQARARAVRAYLLEHFQIAPARIEATGYGSARPLAEFPPDALQQRRVEISALPTS
jgi:OmpA-OmpF porin, OOP family